MQACYRTVSARLFIAAGFAVPHVPQALHPLQAPQEAQLPPQEDFPAFLSRTMLRMRRPVISAITATRTILMRLAESHANIGSHPLEEGQRCEGKGRNLTAPPDEETERFY